MESRTPAHFVPEVRRINWAVMARDHWGSTFEAASFAVYDAVLRPGEVAVDCGVNLGHHTYAMARLVGGSGRVYGFEAAPALLARARDHNAHFPHIRWINKAVFDKPGKATFNYFPIEHGWSGLKNKEDVLGVEQFEVELTTIDQEIDERVALIKLDIEGAEFPALKGASRILSKYAPVIVFENGREQSARDFGYTKDEFFRFFRDHNYQVYSVSGMPLIEELWDDPTHPWQFVAVHHQSPRMVRVMTALSSVANNALIALSAGYADPLPDFRNG